MKRFLPSLLALSLAVIPASQARAADSPTLAIGDATIVESNSGFREMLFPVTLSKAQTFDVSASFKTRDITTQGASDYVPQSAGQVVIKAGKLSANILIRVVGDTVEEKDESFLVQIGAPKRCGISDSDGIGTIQDNDYAGRISISDVSVPELNSGQKVAKTLVSLSPSPLHPISVTYEAKDDGAKASQGDYIATRGTLLFKPGRTVLSVSVPVVGDTLIETDERFFVRIASPGLGIAKSVGTVIILNDDFDAPIAASINDISVNEGNEGQAETQLLVTLDQTPTKDTRLSFATRAGSATAGEDYITNSGTLLFPAGQRFASITLPIVGDTVAEADETFSVEISASGGITGKSSGTVTILNDDTATGSNSSGKIVFTATANGNQDIFVINADGSNVLQLTTDASNDFAPRFSPDGNRVAFVSLRSGSQQLWVMDADGSNQTLLPTSGPANNPDWTSDGQQIVFESRQDADSDAEISVIDLNGDNQVNLTQDPATDLNPSVSSDGTIFFASNRTGNLEIFRMNSDGSNPVRITDNPVYDLGPRPSPVAPIVALYRLDGIYLIDDGSGSGGGTGDGGSDSGETRIGDGISPAFSPDGSQIVFVAQSDNDNALLRIVNADGTGVRTLVTPFAVNGQPSWSTGSVPDKVAQKSATAAPTAPSGGSS